MNDNPVKLDELLRRCMGEMQFAQNILSSFLRSCQSQLQEIGDEIRQGESKVLAQKIHRLKGTAATVAACPLHQSLERLEYLVQSGDADSPEMLMEQFEYAVDEYQKVSEYVETNLL